MIQRCTNAKRADFARYGGRGVTVCERWRKYANFLADLGPRPSPRHSLDRLDSSLGYEPGNVRWATPGEQARNRKTTRFLTHAGKTLCLKDWSAELGISKFRIGFRVRQGWTLQQVIEAAPYSRRPGANKR